MPFATLLFETVDLNLGRKMEWFRLSSIPKCGLKFVGDDDFHFSDLVVTVYQNRSVFNQSTKTWWTKPYFWNVLYQGFIYILPTVWFAIKDYESVKMLMVQKHLSYKCHLSCLAYKSLHKEMISKGQKAFCQQNV